MCKIRCYFSLYKKKMFFTNISDEEFTEKGDELFQQVLIAVVSKLRET